MGRLSRTVERQGERMGDSWSCGKNWERNARGVGEIGHELPHFFQGISLHQDVILGKQQSSNFTQFADRRRVGIRNDGS